MEFTLNSELTVKSPSISRSTVLYYHCAYYVIPASNWNGQVLLLCVCWLLLLLVSACMTCFCSNSHQVSYPSILPDATCYQVAGASWSQYSLHTGFGCMVDLPGRTGIQVIMDKMPSEGPSFVLPQPLCLFHPCISALLSLYLSASYCLDASCSTPLSSSAPFPP